MKNLAIIITAYNSEVYILKTLNSFKKQEMPNKE